MEYSCKITLEDDRNIYLNELHQYFMCEDLMEGYPYMEWNMEFKECKFCKTLRLKIKLEIYNLLEQRKSMLMNQNKKYGLHSVVFNGKNIGSVW